MLGVGATRVEQRIEAAFGIGVENIVKFEPCESVPFGGVLCLLPFLLEQGLLSYNGYYSEREGGFYDYDSVVLLLSFMYLCRIKNMEKLKHYSPGELGKLLGLDRVPEVRCLRGIVKELTFQKMGQQWSNHLANEWVGEEETNIFYIDGHAGVYHGYLANLGKKHIAGQKLCMPGTMDFWVNNSEGMPYFYVTGEVNEKLIEMMRTQLIDKIGELLPDGPDPVHINEPWFTIVFDREGFSPFFFAQLWTDNRVAVISYNKNVKDKWPEDCFTEVEIETDDGEIVQMPLCEKEIEISGTEFREVRYKCDDGHQTSIITTHPTLSLILIAIDMFKRWCQENFFRYMRLEYDFDKIIQYGIEQIDKNVMVVNPIHSKLTYTIKKLREKINRRYAILSQLIYEHALDEIENTHKNYRKQQKLLSEIEVLKTEEEKLIVERKQIPYKITIGQMPESVRYNKLKSESKLLINIIKMICYRAETSFTNLICAGYKRKNDEKRALFKSIVNLRADILPDYRNNVLTIRLYSLSTNRDNVALQNIITLLNETQTIFPGTNLTLFYKFASF
jgi:hypothetical protein